MVAVTAVVLLLGVAAMVAAKQAVSEDSTPPEPFDLLSPKNGTEVTTLTPTLAWENAVDPESGIDHYEVWIDDNKVGKVTNTSWMTPELSPGIHSWYVVAINGAGLSVRSTSTFTFIVVKEKNVIVVGIDYPTIQSALDAIAGSTEFYIIEVQPGTYYECLTINRSNVMLVSQIPREAKIIAPPSSNRKPVEIRGSAGNIIKNIVLKDFHIDGNADAQTSGKCHHGISVDYAENVCIIGNYVTKTHPYHVHDTGGSGINVYPNARWVYILNNEVDDIGDRCIQVSGEHILIENNYLHDGFDRGVSWDVLYESDQKWYHARHVLIRNNRIENLSAGSGIKGRGSSWQGKGPAAAGDHVEDILIIGNTIKNCTHGGIGLGYEFGQGLANFDGNITVENNYIENCGSAKFGGGGIYVRQTSAIGKKISILNNTIVVGETTDPAILISASKEDQYLPCVVSGNKIFGRSEDVKKTIEMVNVRGVKVDNNEFHGLFESLGSFSGISSCEITNNYVEHAQRAITLPSNIDYCTIKGNYFGHLDKDEKIGSGFMTRCTLENNLHDGNETVVSLTSPRGP